MNAKTIMVQGTGTGVGKSIVAAGLCRLFKQKGYRVAPFKSQNMSNNSYVCPDGGEISRAQAVQAEACGIEPRVEMNPILLKPMSNTTAQVVLMGKAAGNITASQYWNRENPHLDVIFNAFETLSREFDLVVIEGAGSPAEINLKKREVTNMRIAKMTKSPVILIGDIDRGGIFAQFVGTMEVLDEEEKAYIRGFIINRFRGEIKILKPGIKWLEKRTSQPVLGVLPFIENLNIAEEDSLPAAKLRSAQKREKMLLIHVIKLPHISNFTDFDIMGREPGVLVRYLISPMRDEIPDLLVIPGSKSTVFDLNWLKAQGFESYIGHAVKSGSFLLGICGGFQMLGQSVLDHHRVESEQQFTKGLGFFKSVTVFGKVKKTARVCGVHIESGEPVAGYEIHMGTTERLPGDTPFIHIRERLGSTVDAFDGAVSDRVIGTYIHGIFDSDSFRKSFLNKIRKARSLPLPNEEIVEQTDKYDRLAKIFCENLDVKALMNIIKGQ